MSAWLLALVLVGCGGSPELRVEPRSGGMDIESSVPLDQVWLVDEHGWVVASRRLPAPGERVWLPTPWEGGRSYHVLGRAGDASGRVEVVTPIREGPIQVEVEAPLGQDPRRPRDGHPVEFSSIEGSRVPVGLTLEAREPVEVVVRVGDQVQQLRLQAAGERAVVVPEVDGPVEVEIQAGAQRLQFGLLPVPLTAAEASSRLEVVDVAFPTDGTGARDPARPPGRVTLPARWWESVVRRIGLGFRVAPDQAPWGWEAVTLANHGVQPLNVLVRSRVVDDLGVVVSVFRPRLREADGSLEEVVTMLRIPGRARATAVLPLYVDRASARPGAWTRELQVVPLGGEQPLLVDRRPLYLSVGNPWASSAFGLTLLGAAGGLAFLARGLRRWLGELRTSDLMTIGLFGSMIFVLSAASQLLGTVLGTVLGPFAPLVYGLLDDVLRTALVATLVTSLPRPGVASLGVLVGWLLQGLAMGSLNPVDLVFVGSRIAWMEGGLWVAGITRSPTWLDRGPFLRWLRLSAALGSASLLSTASGLVLHVMWYRLYFAAWYVAMILALPGFAYVLLGCAIAVPFAASLRQVES